MMQFWLVAALVLWNPLGCSVDCGKFHGKLEPRARAAGVQCGRWADQWLDGPSGGLIDGRNRTIWYCVRVPDGDLRVIWEESP
jgi:hypothetical protein